MPTLAFIAFVEILNFKRRTCGDRKESRDKQMCAGWVNHFAGGLWTNSTPFAMFPLRPSIQACKSFFSYSFTFSSGLCAASAPDG